MILFGHSDGGSIALLTAAKYPARLRAVITEGAHVFVEEITLNGIRQVEENYRASGLLRKLEHYHAEKAERVFRLWADTWLSEGFREWNIERFLPQISCPVLVIQGSRDEYGSMRQVESIEHNISATTARYIPPAGHTPHRERPQTVIRAVQEFLSKI